MQTPSLIVVSGKWASGKSTWSSAFAHFLQFQNLRYLSDRIGLEDAVIYDHGYDPETQEQSQLPVFSKVAGWGPPGKIQFQATDGFSLHRVRNHMAFTIKQHLHQPPQHLLMELATGPNVPFRQVPPPYNILPQTTQDFIERLEDTLTLPLSQAHWIELRADMNCRLDRQGLRHDPTAQEAFNLFAGDGGELTSQLGYRLENLGFTVHSFNNETMSLNDIYLTTRELTSSQLPDPELHPNELYPRLLTPEHLIRFPNEIFTNHPDRRRGQYPEGHPLFIRKEA